MFVLISDSQKAMIGEGVQSGAWGPLVTGLGWAVGIIEASDWANPGGVRVVVMAGNRRSKQWRNWSLRDGLGDGVDASGSAAHD